MSLRISLVALLVTFAHVAAAEPPQSTPPKPSQAPASGSPPSSAGLAAAAPKAPTAPKAPAAAKAPSAKAPAAPQPPTAPKAPAAPQAVATPQAPAAPAQDKSGVVLVEQAGRVAALGVVLNGDGRIVTALSRVTPGQLFVRYANGSLEPARIGHSDPARDLALLVPKTARWQKGLPAARDGLSSPSSAVVAFSLGANRNLSASSQQLAGTVDLAGHTMLKLSSAPKPNELGGPLLDAHGDTVGIVVSGCAGGTANCSAAPLGLPVNEVRAFLRARPPASGYALPRLGIAGLSADTGVVRGLAITSIEPKSPAAALGLRVGADPTNADLLVALAGTPVPNEQALRSELARHAGGDRVELLVFGKDGYRVLATRLAPPEPAKPPESPKK